MWGSTTISQVAPRPCQLPPHLLCSLVCQNFLKWFLSFWTPILHPPRPASPSPIRLWPPHSMVITFLRLFKDLMAISPPPPTPSPLVSVASAVACPVCPGSALGCLPPSAQTPPFGWMFLSSRTLFLASLLCSLCSRHRFFFSSPLLSQRAPCSSFKPQFTVRKSFYVLSH